MTRPEPFDTTVVVDGLTSARDQARQMYGPAYAALVEACVPIVQQAIRANAGAISPAQAGWIAALALPPQCALARLLMLAAALELQERLAAEMAAQACMQARRPPHPSATEGEPHVQTPAHAPAPALAALPDPQREPQPGSAGPGTAVPPGAAGALGATPAGPAAPAQRAVGPALRAAWCALQASHDARVACGSGVGMLACVGLAVLAAPAVERLAQLIRWWLA